MQVNLGKSLLDATQHALVPLDLQIGMQATLHQNSGAAEFDGFANLVVDRFQIEDVPLFGFGSFQWTIKRAECAVLGAEVRVINVAIDDVSDHALGMQFTAHGVSFHADADQVIGAKQIYSLCFGEGHSATKVNSTERSTSFQLMLLSGVRWLGIGVAFCASASIQPTPVLRLGLPARLA